jgi:HAD superfamily hydrolase (TIGR01509 family)
VVFDLDGLMIDSEPLSHAAWQRVLAPHGASLTDAQYVQLIGRDRDTGAKLAKEMTGVLLEPLELRHAHEHAQLEILETGLLPKPGLMEVLQALQARGLPLGVASNSPRAFVKRSLEVLEVVGVFDCVLSYEDVPNAKPAPDLFLAVAAGLGVPAEQCLALEDSPAGFQAALAAGMQVVVIPSPELLEKDFSGAHWRFESLGALLPSLDTILLTR